MEAENSGLEEKSQWKELQQRLSEMAVEFRKRDEWVLVTNHDCDGLTAGAIIAKTMERLGMRYKTLVLKQLYRESISEIKEMGKNYFFCDFGSGQLDFLREGVGENFFVLDHHQPLPIMHALQANPFEFGFDGGNEVSASGMAFLFSLAVSEKNADLAALAVVGAVGDMQDETGKLVGLNQWILERGIREKVLQKKIDLRLYGRISRPLVQFLVFASNPVLPELTANEENCTRFLQELGIDLKQGEEWISYEMLSPEQKKVLSSALIVHLHEWNVPEWKIREMIGEVYSLPAENPRTPLHDAKEFGTLLNACVVSGTKVYLNGTPTEIDSVSSGSIFSIQNNKIVKDTIVQKHEIRLDPAINILEVQTKTGRMVRLTSNHELLSIKCGEPAWVPASNLKKGDYTAISARIPDCTKPLLFQDFFNRNELVLAEEKVRLPYTRKFIKKPVFNRSLGFLLGYIAGDGHLRPTAIDIVFSRKPRDLKSFEYIKRVFAEQFDCNTFSITNKATFFNADWNSKTLVEFVHRLGIKKGNKTKTVHFDKRLLEGNKEFVAGLLSGLFSSDGNVYQGGIEFASHSKELIDQMVFMLQRFGIMAHVTERSCNDCEYQKYRLLVCGKTSAIRFTQEIGFLLAETNRAILERCNKFSEIHSHECYVPVREKLVELGKLFGIPNRWSSHFTQYSKGKQPSKENLQKMLNHYEKQLEDCKNAVYDHDIIATIKSFRTSKSRFAQKGNISLEWLSKIIRGRVAKKNAQKKINRAFDYYTTLLNVAKNKIEKLTNFLDSDIAWDRIKEITILTENIPTQVFDITVEKNHNYIANGIVVHNCGRHGMAEIGLAVCMGNRNESYSNALSLLAQHRKQLREGIQFLKENGVQEKKFFYFVDAEEAIPDSIIGIVAGMLYGSGQIGFHKPILAFARYPDGSIKASGRGTRELVRAGLNLGTAFREICSELGEGNEGGGHRIAAGLKLQPENKELFLELLEKKLEEQLQNPNR